MLKILLLKLLATLEQLLVHLGQTCQFELHLLSSLSELRLPVLFAFIKFYGDLLKSSMHFLDCSLVLLKDLNGLLVLLVLQVIYKLRFVG